MATRIPGRISPFIAKKVGDWRGVIQFFDKMGIEVKKKTIQAQFDICKKLRQKVVGHILAQDLQWATLSRSTQKNKRENKTLIYIDTELYLNSIKVWKDGNGAYVGIKKGTVYKRKTGAVNLERVAIWMEYGTHKQPARPVWGPSMQELGGKEGIRDFVVDAIFRRLKWLAKGKPLKVTRKQINKLVN